MTPALPPTPCPRCHIPTDQPSRTGCCPDCAAWLTALARARAAQLRAYARAHTFPQDTTGEEEDR